jgi:hypothetical protein
VFSPAAGVVVRCSSANHRYRIGRIGRRRCNASGVECHKPQPSPVRGRRTRRRRRASCESIDCLYWLATSRGGDIYINKPLTAESDYNISINELLVSGSLCVYKIDFPPRTRTAWPFQYCTLVRATTAQARAEPLRLTEHYYCTSWPF